MRSLSSRSSAASYQSSNQLSDYERKERQNSTDTQNRIQIAKIMLSELNS